MLNLSLHEVDLLILDTCYFSFRPSLGFGGKNGIRCVPWDATAAYMVDANVFLTGR